jgi:peptidoglycan/LPS O-acetylase OafA/YrhL
VRKYRSDIDGLRAISILSVLLFHLDFEIFSGGYIGVDVFFVISGYLITKLIKEEYEAQGKLDFSNFYSRRIRRLFPAFFVVIVCTFIVAVFIFETADLRRFYGAVFYSTTYLSNIYYWLEGGYFAASADVKPLLHTWSLAVEEQFYIFWPITILLMLRGLKSSTIVFAIVILILFSLILSEILYYGNRQIATFFLLPSRVFEFLLGALMVWGRPRVNSPVVVANVLTALGLGLIMWAVFSYSDATPIPTTYALIPCVGASLIILFGGSGAFSRLVLENRLMVTVGKLSYSLYLVHWPLIIFFGYAKGRSLAAGEQALLFLSSFALAYILYRGVENRFRHFDRKPIKIQSVALPLGVATMLVAFPSAVLWAKGTLLWKYQTVPLDEVQLELVQQGRLLDELTDNIMSNFSASSARKILVIGDSHAQEMARILVHEYDQELVETVYWRYDDPCFPDNRGDGGPLRIITSMFTEEICEPVPLELLGQSDVVVIANHWKVSTIQGGSRTFGFFSNNTAAGTPIILMGQAPSFSSFDYHLFYREGHEAKINEKLYAEFVATNLEVDRVIETVAAENRFYYLNRAKAICDDTARSCNIFGEGGNYYGDGLHLSYDGILKYGPEIADGLRPYIFKE